MFHKTSGFPTTDHLNLQMWFKKNLNRQSYGYGPYSKLSRFLLTHLQLCRENFLLLQEMRPFVLHMFGFADIDKTLLDAMLTEKALTDALYQHLSQLKREQGFDIKEELIQGLAQLFIAKIDDDGNDNPEESGSDPAGSESAAKSDDQIFTLDP